MNDKRIKTCPTCGCIFEMSNYASIQIYCSIKCKKLSPKYKQKESEYNKRKREELGYKDKVKQYSEKESYKKRKDEYEKTEKCRLTRKKYREKIQQTEDFKLKKREYRKEKRINDIQFALRDKLRARIREHLKISNTKKLVKSIDLLGCTIEEYKIYLESKFTDGMSWKNMGFYGWHIDHIKPLASFDLTNLEEQKKAFNYKNTQPLWASDNYRKKDKIING